MRVGIATDHNGVEQKIELIYFLNSLGYEVIDYSKNNTPIDDYPDFAIALATELKNNNIDLGILMCGTGIGMSIAANKVKGIRCAKVSNENEARLAREHNNANIIAISYTTPINDIKEMVRIFLKTSFSNEERHIRRINKITEYERVNHES
jgi:ribose 5-phosphate isomerase B